jgi:hypothetical protein
MLQYARRSLFDLNVAERELKIKAVEWNEIAQSCGKGEPAPLVAPHPHLHHTCMTPTRPIKNPSKKKKTH